MRAIKNFDDITKEVLRYGFDDGPQVNKARVEEWVNEAQLQVARHVAAPEFQETAEQLLTVGTYKYAQPASALAIQSIVYPNSETRLKPVNLQTFDTYLASEIQSPPLIYTVFKAEIWVWPIPSVADKLVIRYVKRPVRLSAPSDVPVIAEDYLHILVEYALMRAYRGEDDYEAATAHQQQYEKDLAKYITDVRGQMDDRPKQLQGTWSG